MDTKKPKTDRLITGLIIFLSVVGILYFGSRAIYENTRRNQENPFEYDIESFKQSGADRISHSEIHRIELDLEHVLAIAIGPNDELYVSGDSSIISLDKEGRVLNRIETTGPVHCIAVDENGEVYAGLNDHVEVFANQGVKRSRWDPPGEEAIFTSIAVSPTAVFVADAGNLTVWKFDKAGNLLQRIGDKDEAKDVRGFIIPSPFFDVAIDPDGFLWAANTGRHSLENFTPDGDLRTTWGEFSMEIEGFCGCCNPSHFTILEDGTCVTSEKGIPRVKIYNRLGEFVSVVAGPDLFQEGTVGLDLARDSTQRIFVLDPAQKAVRVFEAKPDM
ncbi:MAG: hypothetical protein GQ544_07300 [Candidatus Aminicenantes bacterium]|nr:hypothetical protein [Candidatus Aminicenantes bacterium]